MAERRVLAGRGGNGSAETGSLQPVEAEQERRCAMKSFQRITIDPAVMGKACIRGQRVTGGTVVGLLTAGSPLARGSEADRLQA